jgi:hypothetical protein
VAAETSVERAAMLHSDGFGQAATYTPAGGSASSITVILDSPVTHGPLAALGVRQPAYTARVSRDEVATEPAEGGTLVVGSQTFTVRGTVPDDDPSGGFWILDLQN